MWRGSMQNCNTAAVTLTHRTSSQNTCYKRTKLTVDVEFAEIFAGLELVDGVIVALVEGAAAILHLLELLHETGDAHAALARFVLVKHQQPHATALHPASRYSTTSSLTLTALHPAARYSTTSSLTPNIHASRLLLRPETYTFWRTCAIVTS